MKNSSYLLYVCILFPYVIVAQLFGPEQLITEAYNGPNTLVLGEIDDDIFPDIIVGSIFSNDIVAWSENINGSSFGTFQEITNAETRNIALADLDGDGDNDLIVPDVFENKFSWFENTDGQGTFGVEKIIDNNALGAFEAIGADIDGDGDLDVVAAIDLEQSVVWYENLDGQGNFSDRKFIYFGFNGCRTVTTIDIDNDGDLDVVAGSGGDITVSWFENLDGLGNFGSINIVAGQALAILDIHCEDMDGDGDNDIITITGAERKITWHENLNGQGDFSTEKLIVSDIFCSEFFCADLDNDNDIDVLFYNSPSVDQTDGEVGWVENIDGLGNFGPKQLIGGGLINVRSVTAADMDNDGDLDVFSVSLGDDKVVWYENRTILGVEDSSVKGLYISPNPVTETLSITSKEPVLKVTFYQVFGLKLKEISNGFDAIDVTFLASGIYFVSIETPEGNVVKKLIKE